MSQTGTLNALYQVAYAPGIENLIPTARKMQQLVPFVSADRQNGKQYEMPVILSNEAGFTYSLDTQDAYDLNNAIGMEMQSAIVPGNDIVLDSLVGYNQAARASHSATAFKTALGTKFENMISSSEKRIDIGILHGQVGIADIAIGGFDETAPGAVTATFVVSDASWATGIWTGSQKSMLAFYSDSSLTISAGTNLNANATTDLVQITAIDVDTKTITVTSTAGAIEDINDVSATKALRVYWYGTVSGTGTTFVSNEMAGMKRIITNTGSLFGIDASVYDLWRGNTVTITGQLTMAKVLSAVAKAVQRGLETDAYVLVNPDTWADLASNLAALRRFDGSYSRKKSTNGSEVLEYVSQNGTLTIVSYNLVKLGEAFIWPGDKALRVGARKLSMTDPTRGDDDIFFTVPGKAGVGVRTYTNQAIFLEAPAQCVYIQGIVNSSL